LRSAPGSPGVGRLRAGRTIVTGMAYAKLNGPLRAANFMNSMLLIQYQSIIYVAALLKLKGELILDTSLSLV
ncbi:MAG TPA: hypothetical protein VFZ78_11445, partial [Flavisolibacter sp.]